MKKTVILSALFAVGCLALPARATVVVSSVSVTAVPVIGTNSSCATCGTVIKALRLCNNSPSNACAVLQDAGNVIKKFVLCANAQACYDSPRGDVANPQAQVNSLAQWAGELYKSTTAWTVTSSTPSASIYLQVHYDQPNK
jgi:hypothetical protein